MRRAIALLVIIGLLVCNIPALAQSVPYTVKLDASEEIFKGPGKDYDFARKVGSDGVYTIVKESYDEYGNLWGKLKSGAGWVMLEAGAGAVYTFRDVPYTTPLKGSVEIFKAPGYDYIRDIGADGVFTIVEEVIGDDGFLWGRLKSGAGWVRLTDAPMEVPDYTDDRDHIEDSDYTVSLGAWVPIYNKPDEEQGACVGIIGADGVYTIVGEVIDSLGNVWGELKSGAGWVNLNYVRYMGRPAITAYPADVVDLGNAWRECVVDASQYATRIAFRINERLRNFSFTTLSYGDNYEIESTHYWMDRLEAGTYFVASVVFYGDMTTYGVSFVDENGEERNYAVSLSGLNGLPVMNEYVR